VTQEMPSSQKSLDVTIALPQGLQDMGYKELIIKRENGILVTDEDTRILFSFNLDKYKQSVKSLQDALEARKMDERI
jgi:bisphosphoglycerate-independent phosphoglycerate mutase (AlkP superfamily)